MLIGKLPWGMILNWREVFQVKKKMNLSILNSSLKMVYDLGVLKSSL